MRLGDEDVPVGSGAHQSRIVQPTGKQLDLETGQRDRPCIFRAGHDLCPIACRLGRERLRQIIDRDFANGSRLLIAEIGEGWLRSRRSNLALA